MRFEDRVDAGQQLAAKLADVRGEPGLAVLAIPRGGVVVGYEVARALDAPFDVALSRKLGAPHNEELAIGALAEDGCRLLDDFLIKQLRVPPEYIERAIERQQREIERRAPLYRGAHPPLDVRDHAIVVVDDGVATGATMIVTLQSLRARGVRKLVAAAPVIAAETLERLRTLCDRVECVAAPTFFASVGGFYAQFEQVSDNEVRELLADLAETRSPDEG
jgi:putative phosphoribosyl transferase